MKDSNTIDERHLMVTHTESLIMVPGLLRPNSTVSWDADDHWAKINFMFGGDAEVFCDENGLNITFYGEDNVLYICALMERAAAELRKLSNCPPKNP